MSTTFATATAVPLANYYRWQSVLYDWTRWAFLFGRKRLVATLATRQKLPRRILEIGCGTGTNVARLAALFPHSQIIGVDLSSHMLAIAQRKLQKFGCRVKFEQCAYESPMGGEVGFDLIVLSYALSMMNPGYEYVLEACQKDLSPGGAIAVVDFHESRWHWFRRWMGMNHVRMEGHIQSQLRRLFDSECREEHRAYAGLWHWILFVGVTKR